MGLSLLLVTNIDLEELGAQSCAGGMGLILPCPKHPLSTLLGFLSGLFRRGSVLVLRCSWLPQTSTQGVKGTTAT